MLLVDGLADRLKLKEDFMDKKEINIVYKDVDELIPYVNNPRDNAGAVDAVASSIKNFGFKVPIVVDKGNEIVTGHTRLLAAKKLDMKKVPVIIADDLSEAEVKAFRLADNKVGELADWDFNILSAELAELENMDMSQFGFDDFIEDNFDTDFELPDNDAPLSKTMTFTFSNAQFDAINDALDEIELNDYDVVDNNNVNGNKLYKLVMEWRDQLRK